MSHVVVHFACIILVFLLNQSSAQRQQTPQKQSPQRQRNPQSTSLECFMRIVRGGSNGQNVVAGGRTIMYDEPCIGFNPQMNSHKNSGRREGCRRAAYRLAQKGAKPECGQIVHGQCLQAKNTGQSVGDPGLAACYVLAKLRNGSFMLRLLKDCADGKGPDSTDSGPQNQENEEDQDAGDE